MFQQLYVKITDISSYCYFVCNLHTQTYMTGLLTFSL